MAEPQKTIDGSLVVTGDIEVLGSVKSAEIDTITTKTATIQGIVERIGVEFSDKVLTLGDDGSISPVEKASIQDVWDAAEAEYPSLVTRATEKSVATTDYAAAFQALQLYLFNAPGILVDFDVATKINRGEYALAFQSYIQAREALLSAIDGKNLTKAEAALPPADILALEAVAFRDYVELTWTVAPPQDLGRSAVSFVIQRSKDNGATWHDETGALDGVSRVGSKIYAWAFDRATDGYPEKTVTDTWPALDRYRFRIKAVNASGVLSQGWKDTVVDDTRYTTWMPPVPSLELSAAMRQVVGRIVQNRDTFYGFLRNDLQIRKAGTTDWYEPNITGNPYASDDAWKTGAIDGYASLTGTTLAQTVPLAGQTVGLPVDTAYEFRLRTVVDVPGTVGGKRASAWSTAFSVTAKATSAYDIVQKAITEAALNDSAVSTRALAIGAVTAEKITVVNLAAIKGYIGVISGGLDDLYNYWALSSTNGHDKTVGEMRVGKQVADTALDAVYLKVRPGAAGTEADPYIEQRAGEDYIKLTSSGILLKAKTIKIESNLTTISSNTSIVGTLCLGTEFQGSRTDLGRPLRIATKANKTDAAYAGLAMFIGSGEASAPAGLNVYTFGGDTQASRSVHLQTTDFTTDDGKICLQPYGGIVTIGGSQTVGSNCNLTIKRGTNLVAILGSGTSGAGLYGVLDLHHHSQTTPSHRLYANDGGYSSWICVGTNAGNFGVGTTDTLGHKMRVDGALRATSVTIDNAYFKDEGGHIKLHASGGRHLYLCGDSSAYFYAKGDGSISSILYLGNYGESVMIAGANKPGVFTPNSSYKISIAENIHLNSGWLSYASQYHCNNNGGGTIEIGTYQGILPGYPNGYYGTLKTSLALEISTHGRYTMMISCDSTYTYLNAGAQGTFRMNNSNLQIYGSAPYIQFVGTDSGAPYIQYNESTYAGNLHIWAGTKYIFVTTGGFIVLGYLSGTTIKATDVLIAKIAGVSYRFGAVATTPYGLVPIVVAE